MVAPISKCVVCKIDFAIPNANVTLGEEIISMMHFYECCQSKVNR